MGELLIRIKKKPDGSSALSCRRADGSVTWQPQHGAQSRFFPLHDLTHYAVETVLVRSRGFYGLIAEGWNLGDFGKPWPRGPLPLEALISEFTVGFLDQERAAGAEWTAADFKAGAASYFAKETVPVPCELSDAELARVRELRGELFARWAALPRGETLELQFSRVGGMEVR